MGDALERRKAARHRLGADIFYSFFNSKRTFSCKMLNKSRGGICFQTGYEIRPGTEIMIYPADAPPDERDKMQAEGIRARVCWCSKLPECNAFFYQIGVAYK